MARRGGLSPGDRAHLRTGWALAIKPSGPVYVNAAHHSRVSDLVDSVAHEVVHLRWPSLHHGELFQGRLRALLDGYHCTPPRHRLPEAFR